MNGTAITSDNMLGASSLPARPSTVKRSSKAPAPKKMINSQIGKLRSFARFAATANSG